MSRYPSKSFFVGTAMLVAVALACAPRAAVTPAQPSGDAGLLQATDDEYCLGCHNDRLRKADLSLKWVSPSSRSEIPAVGCRSSRSAGCSGGRGAAAQIAKTRGFA